MTRIRNLCIPGDNRDFLQRFQDLAENKYQRQIEVDLNYLIASQDLFQQSISAVGGWWKSNRWNRKGNKKKGKKAISPTGEYHLFCLKCDRLRIEFFPCIKQKTGFSIEPGHH
ncbi:MULTISPECIES: hypothetical protein [unclassified Microcoleus]|uniref:hypothetical protein n=1 Tax=unclassified Microcoleus TaxID=2642155 RepID=UPI002FCF0F2B